jgi:Tol biopolymer transport system component
MRCLLPLLQGVCAALFISSLIAVKAGQPLSSHDLALNAASVRASRTPLNPSANAFSVAAGMSADGRYALLVSAASNLTTNKIVALPLATTLNVFVRDIASNRTVLVSESATGGASGRGDSANPEISPGGRYVVFESNADDLVSNDQNSASDVFLRDIPAGTTTLVSVEASGEHSANSSSGNPVMTPDARYVVFESNATNLVAGDTNGIVDLFVRDVQRGTTVLLTPGARAAGGTGGSSESPSISTNGQRIAFLSTATNLVNGATNTLGDVFVRDVSGGLTYWASRNLPRILGAASQFASQPPILSADGRYVVFKTIITGTAAGQLGAVFRYHVDTSELDTVGTNAVIASETSLTGPTMSADGRLIVYEGTTGGLYQWDALMNQASRIHLNNSRDASTADGTATSPVLSRDGRYLAFLSASTNLVTNQVNGEFQIYLHDLQLDVTRLVTITADGHSTAGDIFDPPDLSADGQFVLFTTTGSDFGALDENSSFDVYQRDMSMNATQLVSPRAPTTDFVTANAWSSVAPGALDDRGRFLVFESTASDLAGNDTNEYSDIFVRNLDEGVTRLLSRNTNGFSANAPSFNPVISDDGRKVAFFSRATDLGPNNNDVGECLYLADPITGSIQLASQTLDGRAVRVDPSRVLLNTTGSTIIFASYGPGIVAGDTGASFGLFQRDMTTGTNVRVNTSPWTGWFAASADARTVVYMRSAGGFALWEAQTGTTRLITPPVVPYSGMRLSPDGRLLFYVTRSETNYLLHLLDTVSGADEALGPVTPSSNRPTLSSSADNRWVAWVSSAQPVAADDTNSAADIVLLDRATGNQRVLTQRPDKTFANGVSDALTMNSNGRFVAFRSLATNLADGSDNLPGNIFLYDRLNDSLVLVSHTASGAPGNLISAMPILSSSGRMIAFHSAASDLVSGDQNETTDAFYALVPQSVVGDSDGDGLPDEWEQRYFAGLQQGSNDDPDGDAMTNSAEYRTGTDPTSAASLFAIQTVVLTADGTITLTWPAAPDRTYQVELTESLSAPQWSPAPTAPVIANGIVQFSDNVNGLPQRFFRISVLTP